MRVVAESTDGDVDERLFAVEVEGERVPGVVWAPAGATDGRPLILMGHGCTQHKKVESLVVRARRYVTAYGFAVAAIDAPFHGERVTPAEAAAFRESVERFLAEGRPAEARVARDQVTRAVKAVPEWRAALDALQQLAFVGRRAPVGYWGLSMGTSFGIPLVAAEPRIRCAVFGLSGLPADNDMLAQAAARVNVPIEFAMQADDEVIPPAAGLALFDALGSREKTLHLNAGGHLGIPSYERASWEEFYLRHLAR